MSQVYTQEFRVRDYELDQYGVVNNAVYLNYLEHTRHEFLHVLGIDPAAVAREGRSLALSEIQVQYKGSLRSRDHFRVELDIEAVRGARVIIRQGIVGLPRGNRILEARVVAVFLNEHGQPLRITQAHKEAFSAYQPTR